MGYLENTGTGLSYYTQNDHGGYQFCTVTDIINYFMTVYVGDDKIINKVNRTDVQFHAYRAMQELSFDTFKSVKAQQIDVPPSLTMILPRDYVNYTKISWVDSAGIKHPLYSTSDTSNPFQVKQNSDGTYNFPVNENLFTNSDFANGLEGWTSSPQVVLASNIGGELTSITVDSSAENPVATFKSNSSGTVGTDVHGWATYIYQVVDATDLEAVSFRAEATTTASSSITISAAQAAASINSNFSIAGTYTKPGSTVRVGLSTQLPSASINMKDYTGSNGVVYNTPTPNSNLTYFDLGYLEWTQGETGVKVYGSETNPIDLTQVQGTIYLVALSIIDHVDTDVSAYSSSLLFDTATVDDISIFSSVTKKTLTEVDPGVSSTFKDYRSHTPSNNTQDDYEDDTYWPNMGERYGLDPARSQVNGSFYIDNRLGKINFSSNISGKTVILDYISDSLGTDGEMQVHKFAEEAMYKWITYGVLSTKLNVPEYIVQRVKKEKFAATRQAKLRLSNIKLEDITQVLRGKSKQIKH